jgi:acyl-CoA thioesterase
LNHREAIVNVKAALSPDDLARACAEAMWKEDDASKGLGMELIEVKPGRAVLSMTVQPHIGLRLCLQQP